MDEDDPAAGLVATLGLEAGVDSLAVAESENVARLADRVEGVDDVAVLVNLVGGVAVGLLVGSVAALRGIDGNLRRLDIVGSVDEGLELCESFRLFLGGPDILFGLGSRLLGRGRRSLAKDRLHGRHLDVLEGADVLLEDREDFGVQLADVLVDEAAVLEDFL